MLQGHGAMMPWPFSFGVVINSITGRFVVDGVFLIISMDYLAYAARHTNLKPELQG
jgi:hypothetical protein